MGIVIWSAWKGVLLAYKGKNRRCRSPLHPCTWRCRMLGPGHVLCNPLWRDTRPRHPSSSDQFWVNLSAGAVFTCSARPRLAPLFASLLPSSCSARVLLFATLLLHPPLFVSIHYFIFILLRSTKQIKQCGMLPQNLLRSACTHREKLCKLRMICMIRKFKNVE